MRIDNDDIVVSIGGTGRRGSPGLLWRGEWDSETTYNLKDVVYAAGSSWTPKDAGDLVNLNVYPPINPDRWELVASKGSSGDSAPDVSGASAHDEETTYMAGDPVVYGGAYYEAIADDTTGAFDANSWRLVGAANLGRIQGVDSEEGASAWNPYTNYLRDQLVTHDGILYAAKDHIPAYPAPSVVDRGTSVISSTSQTWNFDISSRSVFVLVLYKNTEDQPLTDYEGTSSEFQGVSYWYDAGGHSYYLARVEFNGDEGETSITAQWADDESTPSGVYQWWLVDNYIGQMEYNYNESIAAEGDYYVTLYQEHESAALQLYGHTAYGSGSYFPLNWWGSSTSTGNLEGGYGSIITNTYEDYPNDNRYTHELDSGIEASMLTNVSIQHGVFDEDLWNPIHKLPLRIVDLYDMDDNPDPGEQKNYVLSWGGNYFELERPRRIFLVPDFDDFDFPDLADGDKYVDAVTGEIWEWDDDDQEWSSTESYLQLDSVKDGTFVYRGEAISEDTLTLTFESIENANITRHSGDDISDVVEVIEYENESTSTSHALQFKTISDNSSSYIDIEFDCNVGIFEISYEVSSEPWEDYVRFYLNGEWEREDSGTTGGTETFFLNINTPGRQVLRIEYDKDSANSSGDDTVRIYKIVYPRPQYNTNDLVSNSGSYYRVSVDDAGGFESNPSDYEFLFDTGISVESLGAAPAEHTHVAADVTDLGTMATQSSSAYAALASANTFTAAQLIDGSVNAVQLRVQGSSDQSSSSQTWETSAGSVLASVSSSGRGTFTGVTSSALSTIAYADAELRVDSSSGGTGPTLRLAAPAGATLNSIIATKGGLNRWALRFGDSSTESGSNAGSNFELRSYTDAGAYLSSPLSIARGTGTSTFTGSANVQSGNLSLIVGADTSALTLTNNSQKSARFGVPHYANAEEPAAFAFVQSDSGANTVNIGGGTGLMNAATSIAFWTGNGTAIMTGTQRLTIGATGVITSSGQLFVDGSSDIIQSRFQAHSTQTNHITTWEDSAGTVLSYVGANGAWRTSATFGSTASGKAYLQPNGTAGEMLINTNAAANKGLVVQGVSAQSGNLIETQDSAGTAIAQFKVDGELSLGGTAKIRLWNRSIQGTGGGTLMIGGSATGSATDCVSIDGNVTSFSAGVTSGEWSSLRVGQNNNPNASSTAVHNAIMVNPTINYASGGSGSYNALRIKVTETALPSGANYLIRAQAGASGTTDIFSVRNNGDVTSVGSASFAGVTSTAGMKVTYAAKTATYPITTSDYIIDCTANTFTVTLPTAVSDTGRTFIIKNSGTGTITVATTSSQTIDGSLTFVLSTQYEAITVVSDGTNWKII